ncbi:hypothetical protein CYMTET_22178, partial [Cymbomonas tetramitiformis]
MTSQISKKGLEDFRRRQFAGPNVVCGSSDEILNNTATTTGPTKGLPDARRVIIHFDVDAFYAQVEEVRDHSLRHKPLGITQKYL